MIGRNRLARITALIGALAVSTVYCATNARAQTTSFKFTSTPGSWVGHGYLNYSITPADGWNFTATGSTNHSFVRLSARDPRPGAPLSNYYWDLELESPDGGPLEPGFYNGATRYPFNDPGEPGLTLSGNHRGNNQNTGYFTVLEADFGVGAAVNRFAVNFRQYDEGNPNNWVDGQFRYNSLIPEPSALVLLGIAGLAATSGRHRFPRAPGNRSCEVALACPET
jgi:hypothetical protein